MHFPTVHFQLYHVIPLCLVFVLVVTARFTECGTLFDTNMEQNHDPYFYPLVLLLLSSGLLWVQNCFSVCGPPKFWGVVA